MIWKWKEDRKTIKIDLDSVGSLQHNTIDHDGLDIPEIKVISKAGITIAVLQGAIKTMDFQLTWDLHVAGRE